MSINFKLGKGEYVHDDRTLMLAKFVKDEIRIPASYDFDKSRAGFPVHAWGNDEWGDCVIAGRANHLVRLERVEQRRTVPLTDDDAVALYKALTGAQTPGDAHDTGLVVLDAMRQWKNQGWNVPGKTNVSFKRNYTIAAYGELDPHDPVQLRTAIYTMHGIHMGFALPAAAQQMTHEGTWDYKGESGAEWQPGSWGGHLVYSKAYDKDSLEILTWGMKVKVTNAFIERYCDEAWAVVDNLDSWRAKQTIDVAALENQLRQITTKVDA